MTRPAQRRELAEKAVATKGVSIALACRAFGVSETCFRYSPKRDEENEMIADLLMGLTNVHKTWVLGHVDKWRSQRRIEAMSMKPRKLWTVLS